MMNRNPLDLGCAYGETSRKAKENKGQNGIRELRGSGSETFQSAQVRDNQGQKGLVPSLQFGVGNALASNARRNGNHALVVVQVTLVERERALGNVTLSVLHSIVRVGALPCALVGRRSP